MIWSAILPRLRSQVRASWNAVLADQNVQPGDIRVIETRQNLAFISEALHDVCGILAGSYST
jgi:hypothetical protein